MCSAIAGARQAEVLGGIEADPVDAACVSGVEGEEFARVNAPHSGRLVGRGCGQKWVAQPGQAHVPKAVLVTNVLLL